MLRMPGAGERFGADQLLPSEVDLRLIPELDPALAQGLVQINPGGERLRMPELEVAQDFQEYAGVERLFERGQHL